MKRMAIASHVALIDGKEYDGIGNILKEALSTENVTYCMVRHSMEGGLPSIVEEYNKGDKEVIARLPVIRKFSLARYTSEIITTIAYFTFRKKIDLFVGIDPLNAFAGIILRKLGRANYCVFYTPDYSPKRFNNKYINNIYHAIDRFCVRHADEIWCVSPRIAETRKQMGVNEDRIMIMPNVPPSKFAGLRKNKHAKYTLITYGIIDKQLDFEGAIKAVALLQGRHPQTRLIIVGNGPEESKLKQIAENLGVTRRIDFMGQRPFAETLELASRAGVGLALYTGEWGFNAYGDSTKCREYFFFGLPVISTDTHATVPELVAAKAGIIVKKNVQDYVKALEKIFADYDTFAVASEKLGQRYDDVHKKQLLRLLNQ